jgi:hypothetical protein
MKTEDRVKILLKKYSKPVKITDPIIDGFRAAWGKPGYDCAADYVRACDAAGLFPALFQACAAAGLFPALVRACDAAGMLPALVRVCDAADMLPALFRACDEKQKNTICDAMGVEK